MTIDLARELSVRAIAHNLALKFPAPPTDAGEGTNVAVMEYALRVAALYEMQDRGTLAAAGVALWRATAHEDTTHTTLQGLQPEEHPACD
jgi:hypothetical protein